MSCLPPVEKSRKLPNIYVFSYFSTFSTQNVYLLGKMGDNVELDMFPMKKKIAITQEYFTVYGIRYTPCD